MLVYRVLLLLPVLLASAQGPSDGCTLNTTVVATDTSTAITHVGYSTSIVETGEHAVCINACFDMFSSVFSVFRVSTSCLCLGTGLVHICFSHSFRYPQSTLSPSTATIPQRREMGLSLPPCVHSMAGPFSLAPIPVSSSPVTSLWCS